MQLTFDDVVDSELMRGDADYTAWLAAGRPRLDKPPPRDTRQPRMDAERQSVAP